MSEKIPNPFKKEWEKFDVEEFKDYICELIDKMVKTKDQDRLNELIDAADDEFSYLIALLNLKDRETITVIKIKDIDKRKLQEMGMTKEDLEGFDEDSYIPLDLDCEDKENKKDNWIV